MYRQVRGCVLNFLLENHFGSKAEMARQLDVSLRTVERLFESLNNAKAGSIVFDKAIWYCAKSRIPLDWVLERYMNEAKGEQKMEMLRLPAHERLILKRPLALSIEGNDVFDSMKCFLHQSSARICPQCTTWCEPWDGRHDAAKLSCCIGHMACEIVKDIAEFYTVEGDDG